MDIFSTIRIATVVGLSAVKIISAVLRVKEAKKRGLINLPSSSSNNNQPCNHYSQQTYYNNANHVAPQPQPMPQPQPIPHPMPMLQPVPQPAPQPMPAPDPYQNSRRNCYYNPPQQPVVNNNNAGSYVPQYEETPCQSRRTMGYSNYTRPVYLQYQYPTTNYAYSGSCGGIMEESDGSFWRSFYNNKTNYSPGYMNQPNYYGQQGWYNSNNTYKELRWADKSLGEMGAAGQPRPPTRQWTPMFNWNNPILRKTPQQWQQSGVVAMFYTEDGQPLFGPSPIMA